MNLHKIGFSSYSIIFLSYLSIHSMMTSAHEGRFTLRGLSGSTTYADIDGLLPLYQNDHSLLYGDVQAKYNQENTWFSGLGLGYRYLQPTRVLGGDIFIDRAESKHHNHYWIVSPGIETIMPCWDVRLNAYIPVNTKRNEEASFFPSGLNECGIHGDCSFVEFHGHQQFEHRFLKFEEVGPGGDLIIGLNLSRGICINLHSGVYYYHLETADDVAGLGVRFDVPINRSWAITAQASYDNEEHAAAAVGLRLQLDHTCKWKSCPALCDRLYDPVLRHIGPIEQGTGVPVVHHQKHEGLFLRKDNIFFFSENGTAILGSPNAGTFENPFAADQFTDATVAAVGPNVNFYFSTGQYIIDPSTIDHRVTLVTGQSIFGRNENFKCTAVADERPELAGGIDIINSHHTIDSIQLENIQSGLPATIVALNITDADDVHLCNDIIHSETNVAGDNAGINVAVGIVANNSTVIIDNSVIEAIARIGGNNTTGTINAASAIGAFNTDFADNIFVIHNSLINANAQIIGNNLGLNFATSIGNTVRSLAASSNANFVRNIFSINCSSLNALSEIMGDSGSVVTGGFNFATNIGNNIFNAVAAAGSSANFSDNIFLINTSLLNSEVEVAGTNNLTNSFAANIGNNAFGEAANGSTANFTTNYFAVNASCLASEAEVAGDNNGSFNFTTNIGNNVETIIGSFSNNLFSINCSSFTAIADVGRNSDSNNVATNIGNNASSTLAGDFASNNFSINNATFISEAKILGGNAFLNSAINIGNNAFNSVANFSNNSFLINDSTLRSVAQINGVNIEFNFATNIGNNSFDSMSNFMNNAFSIRNSLMSATAEVGSNNLNMNTAKNIGNTTASGTTAFVNNRFEITCTRLGANALVRGNNANINLAMGVDFSGTGNNMDISNSVVDILASITGINAGTNRAIGLSALGAGSTIRIFDSLVNVTALANAELNTAINSEGNVVAVNTTFNTFESP